MTMTMTRLIVFISSSFLISNIISQEVIATQGNSTSNSVATLDYTIGEVVILTGTDGKNDVTQGFHQPVFEITNIETIEISFEVSIYPNPAVDLLNIQFEEVDKGSRFELYDANGKLLITREINDHNMSLPFNEYETGLYFISFISSENQLLKTFKIQKSY
jgi:hypothetical protein